MVESVFTVKHSSRCESTLIFVFTVNALLLQPKDVKLLSYMLETKRYSLS